MHHALEYHKALGERAFAAKLWIDGTAPDDTYQGDATQGLWVVFDIGAQRNIAGPFTCDQKAREALLAILEQRSADHAIGPDWLIFVPDDRRE